MIRPLLKYLHIVFVLLFIVACNQNADQANSTNNSTSVDTMTVSKDNEINQDSSEVNVKTDSKTISVVSLTPAVTELLALIIDEKELVAVTTNCNYPIWVANKAQIQTYPLVLEQVLAQKPTHIFYQKDLLNPREVEDMKFYKFPIYALELQNIDSIPNAIKKIGNILNKPKAKKLADDLQNYYKACLKLKKRNKTVLALADTKSLYAAGQNTFIDQVIRYGGFKNSIQDEKLGQYPRLTIEKVLALNPDYIMLPENVVIDQFDPVLQNMKAFKQQKFIKIPKDIFARPGSRVQDFIEIVKNVE